jgi:hypothetical protein
MAVDKDSTQACPEDNKIVREIQHEEIRGNDNQFSVNLKNGQINHPNLPNNGVPLQSPKDKNVSQLSKLNNQQTMAKQKSTNEISTIKNMSPLNQRPKQVIKAQTSGESISRKQSQSYVMNQFKISHSSSRPISRNGKKGSLMLLNQPKPNNSNPNDKSMLSKDSKKISIPISKPGVSSPNEKNKTTTGFQQRVKLSDISKSRNKTQEIKNDGKPRGESITDFDGVVVDKSYNFSDLGSN